MAGCLRIKFLENLVSKVNRRESSNLRWNYLPRFSLDFISIQAIVRKTEKRPQFVSKNAPEMGLWYYKDLEEMGHYYGTEPVMVDAVYGNIIRFSQVEYKIKKKSKFY